MYDLEGNRIDLDALRRNAEAHRAQYIKDLLGALRERVAALFNAGKSASDTAL